YFLAVFLPQLAASARTGQPVSTALAPTAARTTAPLRPSEQQPAIPAGTMRTAVYGGKNLLRLRWLYHQRPCAHHHCRPRLPVTAGSQLFALRRNPQHSGVPGFVQSTQ